VKAPPEVVEAAKREVRALLAKIFLLDLIPAAELIRSDPPSPEAIAMLAFEAHDLFTREHQRWKARRRHKDSLAAHIAQLVDSGLRRYEDLTPAQRASLPAKKAVQDAISRAKLRHRKFA
jgi:hypothetical protein